MTETKARTSQEEVRDLLIERGGIININKPQGMTSHDVVGKMRRILHIKKIGHTGTLDPMATGVLPICIGRGTRIIEYLDLDWKTYRCKMVLGRAFDTQDITGEVVASVEPSSVDAITEEQVVEKLQGFTGLVEQLPPMYSAIKLDGKKLYEYARAGQTDQVLDRVKRRKIFVRDITLEGTKLSQGWDSEITFTVTCSKGTYVRTICEDLGQALGVYGAMSELTRIQSGIFTIEDAVDLTELAEMSPEEIMEKVQAPQAPLADYGVVEMAGNDVRRITCGMKVWVKHLTIVSEPRYAAEEFPLPMREELKRTYLAYGLPEKRFLGIVTMDPERENIKADKIFEAWRNEN